MRNILKRMQQILGKHPRNNRFPDSDVADNSHICTLSTISSKCRIQGMATVIESQLMTGTELAHSAYIYRSYLGQAVRVANSTRLISCSIGAFSYISESTIFHASRLGTYCSIGPQVMSGYGEHPTSQLSTSPIFYSTNNPFGFSLTEKHLFTNELAPVDIGSDVWIGARVYVRNGIKIGDGAIIGAGAVVTKDVPPYAIVGGVPARLIRFRFNQTLIEKLLDIRWWEFAPDSLKSVQPLFESFNESTADILATHLRDCKRTLSPVLRDNL